MAGPLGGRKQKKLLPQKSHTDLRSTITGFATVETVLRYVISSQHNSLTLAGLEECTGRMTQLSRRRKDGPASSLQEKPSWTHMNHSGDGIPAGIWVMHHDSFNCLHWNINRLDLQSYCNFSNPGAPVESSPHISHVYTWKHPPDSDKDLLARVGRVSETETCLPCFLGK